MNQQSANTDDLLRAVEDQSLPDLSFIDIHWKGMGKLLTPDPPTGIQQVVIKTPVLALSLIVMIISCLFVVITSRPFTNPSQPINEDPVNINKVIQPANVFQDTTPVTVPIKETTQPAKYDHARVISPDTTPPRRKAFDHSIGRAIDPPGKKSTTDSTTATNIPQRKTARRRIHTINLDTVLPPKIKTNEDRAIPRKTDNRKRTVNDSIIHN